MGRALGQPHASPGIGHSCLITQSHKKGRVIPDLNVLIVVGINKALSNWLEYIPVLSDPVLDVLLLLPTSPRFSCLLGKPG